MRRRFADFFRVGVAGLLLAASLAAAAQAYPAKPVRIIVPFAPGGGNDFIARFIAQRLSVALGQQFVVENRAGAGGMVGVEVGVKSPPDGYTLTLVSNSYTVNPSLYKLRFDPVAGMTPVIQISRGCLTWWWCIRRCR
jgi:tripartite-type tricarboxylate transporter receptor subunit TctC